MATKLYCNYIQDGIYNADDDRFTQSALLPRDASGKVKTGLVYTGVTTDGSMQQTTPASLSVTVNPFVAVTTDGLRGGYIGGLDGQLTIDVLAPETINNRVDVLYWMPLDGLSLTTAGDPTTSSGIVLPGSTQSLTKQTIGSEIYWQKGAPSSSTSPVVPTPPANAVVLGQVYVPGAATAISTTNITVSRTWVTSTVPDGPANQSGPRSIGTGALQAAAGNHTHAGAWQNLSLIAGWVSQDGPVQFRVNGQSVEFRGKLLTESSSAVIGISAQFASTTPAQFAATGLPSRDHAFPVAFWSGSTGAAIAAFCLYQAAGALKIYPAATTSAGLWQISLDGATLPI